MDFKAIIFDMDGTLLDSMRHWRNFVTIFLEHQGIQPPANLREQMKGLTFDEIRPFLNQKFDLTLNKEEFEDAFHLAMEPVYANQVTVKPDVVPFLEKMKQQGVPMCVATATRSSTAKKVIREKGLDTYMEFVMSCSDVQKGKEEPDLYLTCAERLGVPVEEITIFEDALYCVQTAKRAGFSVVGIADDTAARDRENIIQLSDRFIEGYAELLS